MPPSPFRRARRSALTRAALVVVVALAAAAAPSAAAPQAPPDAGAVAPGDRLVVRVWREAAWSDSVVVGGDGDVVLPRIGRLRAAGLTPAALRDTVQARFAYYLRDPSLDLLVLRRVAVLGAVRKPNVYYVDPTTTLRDVLAQAGGTDETADQNRIDLVRDGVRRPLGRWRDVAESAAPVRSGDQLVVGTRPWIARNALTVVSSLAVAVSVLVSAFQR